MCLAPEDGLLLTLMFSALVRNTVFLKVCPRQGAAPELQHTNRKGTTERELFIYLFPLLPLKLTVMMLLWPRPLILCASGKADWYINTWVYYSWKTFLKTQGEGEMVGSNLPSLREKISPRGVLNDTEAFGCGRKSASFMKWVSSILGGGRLRLNGICHRSPDISACCPLRTVWILLKSWLCLCSPGLGCSLQSSVLWHWVPC